MESNTASISTNSPSTWTWCQKINILNKAYWQQYLILGCWIIAFGLMVFYITYQSSIPELIENSILPADLIWMIYVSAGFFIISIMLLVVTPISPQFHDKLSYSTMKNQIIDQVAEFYLEKRYSEINTSIEQLLTMREQYHFTDDVHSLLEWMQKAQVNRFVLDRMQICREHLQKHNFLEAKTEFQQLQSYINSFIPFVNSDIFQEIDLLFNQINSLQQSMDMNSV